MHNWPRADYLQVRLGRVKNSISSAQALGTRFHRGGLFLVNGEEMASHFKPSQGEDSGSFTFYQGNAWLHRPEGRSQESKRGHTFQRKSRLSPSLGARRQRQGLLGAAWLESHPATALTLTSHPTPTPARPQPNCFSFSHNNPPPSP